MPAINREYWLEFAKASISKSIESRENAATKLDSFLAWLWVIYTSVFALASVFDVLSADFWQLIAVGQPILFIMLARFFCIYVLMPVPAVADPAVVTQIIDGFQEIVQGKRERLRLAIIFTFVAMISLCGAIVCYNLLDPQKEGKKNLRDLKLKKQVYEQTIPKSNSAQNRLDSLKLENEILKEELKSRLGGYKKDYFNSHKKVPLDTVILMDR